MKAAVLYGKEDVRVEEVPMPALEPGEVLVRIRSALTCGTDLKIFRNGSHARMLKPPALFGHEFAGVVEKVGANVRNWKPGMRVMAANSAPCGGCFFCKRNQANLCEDLLFVNGAYAEFLRIPERIVQKNLLPVPENLSFQAAALTEPLACVLRGFEAVHPSEGETVLVLGAGPVGLFFVQLAARAGCKVLVTGKGTRRLETARQCGAHEVYDLKDDAEPWDKLRKTTPHGKGPDVVVEAVGRPAAWSQAVSIVRPGGRVLFFGGCPSGTEVSIDTRHMHYDELTLFSTFHHTPEAIRQALHLLTEGAVRAEGLITEEAPLQELPAILKRMLTEQDAVKTAILP